MNHPTIAAREWDESASATGRLACQTGAVFESFFERSLDAVLLFDPQTGVFVDCNPAAVELLRAGSKEKLLGARPEDLSPPFQSDGTPTGEKSAQVTALVEERGGHRFEWVGRRFDGTDIPLEVFVTQIHVSRRAPHATVSHEHSEGKL